MNMLIAPKAILTQQGEEDDQEPPDFLRRTLHLLQNFLFRFGSSAAAV